MFDWNLILGNEVVGVVGVVVVVVVVVVGGSVTKK